LATARFGAFGIDVDHCPGRFGRFGHRRWSNYPHVDLQK
jgi:hypothetical protein